MSRILSTGEGGGGGGVWSRGSPNFRGGFWSRGEGLQIFRGGGGVWSRGVSKFSGGVLVPGGGSPNFRGGWCLVLGGSPNFRGGSGPGGRVSKFSGGVVSGPGGSPNFRGGLQIFADTVNERPYASYWNAFLSIIEMTLICSIMDCPTNSRSVLTNEMGNAQYQPPQMVHLGNFHYEVPFFCVNTTQWQKLNITVGLSKMHKNVKRKRIRVS